MTRRLAAVPDTPPRAVLYLRQSTYREESISLELQETAGRDYCARQGYQVVDVLADPGVSGRTWRRPAVQRAMSMLEQHEADVVVLWRWSRLSRSRKDWALAADRADVAGGRIESATEPNDVTAAGRFARGVMTELAAFESERIGEQWREVQASRVARGLPPGGKLPWGWRWSAAGPAEVDGERGAVIAELYARYLAGAGSRALAAWLDDAGWRPMHRADWNDRSVTQLLDSPVHAGFVAYRGEVHPGAHDGVIDEATWQAYRRERARRREGREVRRRYLLSGVARCAACGEPMNGATITNHPRSREPWSSYRCRSLGKGPHAGKGPWSLALHVVESALLAWLREVADDTGAIADAAAAAGQDSRLDAQHLAREVATLDQQLARLTEQLAADVVPVAAYTAARDSILARRERLAVRLDEVEARARTVDVDPREHVRGLLAEWDELAVEDIRAGLRLVVDHVRVDCAAKTAVVVPRWADQ
jgi:DNA invertase Pin-like site-specific DNA recombinase